MAVILHNNHVVSLDNGVAQGRWKHLHQQDRNRKLGKYRFQCWCGDVTYTNTQRDLRSHIAGHLSMHLGPIS